MPLLPDPATADADAVWRVAEAFNRAFAALYFTFLDEAVTVLAPANPYRADDLAHDREGFEHALRSGDGQVGYFQALQPTVAVFGDAAIVTYHSRGRYGLEGRARPLYLKETDVLVRRAAGWKSVHLHVSAKTA